MQVLYQSDRYVVLSLDAPAGTPLRDADGRPLPASLQRGSFEILDKTAGRDLFLEGALAESFREGALALAASGPDEEAIEAYLDGYIHLPSQPLVQH